MSRSQVRNTKINDTCIPSKALSVPDETQGLYFSV